MNYKLLGRTGLRVSEICLGTMTFGKDWGWGSTKAESKKIFNAYTEAGGNFLDTANRYTEGTSEKYLGDFISKDRDHFVVATKYTLYDRKEDVNFSGNSRQNQVVIPIVGARTLQQIKDSLGVVDVELSTRQVGRLNDASQISMGFPHEFLLKDGVKDVVFGGTISSVKNHRRD